METTVVDLVVAIIDALQKVFMSVADRELQKAKLKAYAEAKNDWITNVFNQNANAESQIEGILLSNYEEQLKQQQEKELSDARLKFIGIALFVIIIVGLLAFFATRKTTK